MWQTGDVALPGGKMEEGDVDDSATALREAMEEIGLEPNLVQVVATLQPFTFLFLFLFFFLIGSIAGSVQTRPARPESGNLPAEFGLPVAGLRRRQNSGGRIPALAGFRRPDVVGLLHRLDPEDRQLLNSDDQISNMRVRTKSLISKNDLRF
jgi:8-oxo-dGTP pyrophosphatase MutT (NUDIX family)